MGLSEVQIGDIGLAALLAPNIQLVLMQAIPPPSIPAAEEIFSSLV